MSNAQSLFVVYGTVILAVGFILGSLLGIARMKAPAVRSLAMAHVETLMQSSMHLGLAFAVGAVGFGSTTATVGAALMVSGSALQAIGVTLNWITKTKDQFAEKSPGLRINVASSLLIYPGLIIIVSGVLLRVGSGA